MTSIDIKRRHLALALAATPLLTGPARAAGEPAEGREYVLVQQPQAVAVAGKTEVIEFFGYWCPHCRSLEPTLEAWAQKLPADVNFRRVPVAWRPGQETYQRLYFALEAVGAPPSIHRKVFDAVQVQGMRLDLPAALTVFAAANGIDPKKLADAMSGFAVSSKTRVATQVVQAYRIEGVPAFVVQGRFLTSPEKVGSDEGALKVVDALVRKAKTAR